MVSRRRASTVVLSVPWERDQSARTSSGPAIGDISRSWIAIRRANAFTRRSISTIRTSSPKRASRHPRATRSSISRWSTRWRCGRLVISSRLLAAWRCGRRAASRSPARTARCTGRKRRSCQGCGSIRMPCAKRTPITVRPSRRSCSGTLRRRSATIAIRWFDLRASPGCRTTSSPTRRRTGRPTACIAVSAKLESRRAGLSRGVRRLVALFQHFSLPDVRHRSPSRGDLASQNRLGELAQQFGRALMRGALRSASARLTATEVAASKPDRGVRRVFEPHGRGAILVAAVFDAFLTLYKNSIAGLPHRHRHRRPAGRAPPSRPGEPSADEAAGVAGRMLPCASAPSICPPVDITFGDYLRDADRQLRYDGRRRAAVRRPGRAFRRYGIVPEEVGRCRSTACSGVRRQPARRRQGAVLQFVKTWVGDIAVEHEQSRRISSSSWPKRRGLHQYWRTRSPGTVINGIDPRCRSRYSIRPSIRPTSKAGATPVNIELTQRVAVIDPPAERAADAGRLLLHGGCARWSTRSRAKSAMRSESG